MVTNLEIMTFGKVEGLVMYSLLRKLGGWSSYLSIFLMGIHNKGESMDMFQKVKHIAI